ncbi:hypothetical protein [Alteromonas sp. C1M14]|uniref:hypothetical protein n=1 Tax=Alteromonas sp. C1M14 TaxID=2841567 RepID=UPI001C08F04B|nr:hypothetical protein [Alteromonas sp. C1M14]MBU2978563.1 hypothetical protein [Alteromonas sp. C1M14]
MTDVKERKVSWFKKALSSRHEVELIGWTLFFGAVTFSLFWLTVQWQLLPDALLKPHLSQEDTGLFDALGGWALGFAGAMVAIRIAGLAKTIQENDSIREQVKMMEAQVEQVSRLNSSLNQSIIDAKRACAAVILFAKELERGGQLTYGDNYLWNVFNKRPTNQDLSDKLEKRKEALQEKLEEKLAHLVKTIEESFQNSAFRDVLRFIEQHAANQKGTTIIKNGSEGKSFISLFFKHYHEGFEAKDSKQKELIDVVKKNEVFFEILDIVKGLGTRNFGIGVMELRALDLIEHYKKDLLRLLKAEGAPFSSDETKEFQISDAAWLLLGLLLYRTKSESLASTDNAGFVTLALILGSLPTKDTVKQYLESKRAEVEKPYSEAGRTLLSKEIEELAQSLYFLEGEELTDLEDLIKECCQNTEFLTVLTANIGVSQEYVNLKTDKDSFDFRSNETRSEEDGNSEDAATEGNDNRAPDLEKASDKKAKN